MNSPETQLTTASCPAPCAGRRQFLTRTVVGGLAIALGATVTRADDDDAPLPPAKTPANAADNGDLVIKPSDYPELGKVGGFVTLDTKAGKIVVARADETKFVAVGAVCTHKGGPIEYDAPTTQFYCPWHKIAFRVGWRRRQRPGQIADTFLRGRTGDGVQSQRALI